MPSFAVVDSSGGSGALKHWGSPFGCQSVGYAIDSDLYTGGEYIALHQGPKPRRTGQRERKGARQTTGARTGRLLRGEVTLNTADNTAASS
jgi:hypothetical protein